MSHRKTVMYDLANVKAMSDLSSDYTTIQQIMPVVYGEASEGDFI